IFSDAAIFYQPKNANMLAERIYEAIGFSEEKCKGIKKKAIERAKHFSWDICAAKVVDVLDEAVRE
ncbi:MAG: hypothetical protein IMZ61_08100, partial [Planctomycetes bacterium]|nr:hypothetical protein [Planctomycetota bacterium]